MNELFCIYIDRLKEGVVQKIDLSLSPDFFEVSEQGLCLDKPTQVTGETYLTDEDLVVHFSASTIVQMPCAVCNQMTPFILAVKNFYHAEPLINIRTAVFDIRSVVREALLVELPNVIECNGECKERASITPYLRKAEQNSESYFPFSDLNKT